MAKILGLRGSHDRGNDIIKVLCMFGASNTKEYLCNNICNIYFMDDKGRISYLFDNNITSDKVTVLTIEEFEKMYPYEVGETVIYDNKELQILRLKWLNNTVLYYLTENYVATVSTLRSIEVTKKSVVNIPKIDLSECSKDMYEVILGDYEIKFEGNMTLAVRKGKVYPRNYIDCCKILGERACKLDDHGYMSDKLYKLQKLLICRDAFWKIENDWKPDYNEDNGQTKYSIYRYGNKIKKNNTFTYTNLILQFPTEEMRDYFYDNFMAEIEACAEFI